MDSHPKGARVKPTWQWSCQATRGSSKFMLKDLLLLPRTELKRDLPKQDLISIPPFTTLLSVLAPDFLLSKSQIVTFVSSLVF